MGSDDEETLLRALLHTLRHDVPVLPPLSGRLPPTVIFARTRSSCERIASFLCDSGISAVALHGGCSMQYLLHQQQLLHTRHILCVGPQPCSALLFRGFCHTPCPVVATDAMGRGLDWGGAGGVGLVIECPLAENAGG